MELNELAPVDPRATITTERDEVIALLDGLTDAEWVAPTEAGHWRVKEVALHLLDDELGWLSRERDRDTSGLLPITDDYRAFVRSIDEKNERWVVAAGGLSRRVVGELLQQCGAEVDRYFASIDLHEPSRVIWASHEVVPRWFDLCRDLTERWVHQQHLRDAVGRPGRHEERLPEVLATFVWAFPHQYTVEAPVGSTVQIGLGADGTWHLRRRDDRWVLERGPASAPAASIELPATIAWRQLTGLPVPAGAVTVRGPDALVGPLLDVRGIIA